MVDSVDRMHFSSIFTLSPGICRVVYLPTVYVDNYTLEDLEILGNGTKFKKCKNLPQNIQIKSKESSN
jgi:hypothetical protein